MFNQINHVWRGLRTASAMGTGYLAVILLAHSAMATPAFVEPKVAQFMSASSMSSKKTFPVLIVFHSNVGARIASGEVIGRSEVAKALRLENHKHAGVVRHKFKWASRMKMEALWIINGLFMNLTSRQIQALSEMREVKGIYWSRKPIELKKIRPQEVEMEREDFTNGLKKIGVPTVRQRTPRLTGAGVRVGVIDTGIDPNHPDLKGRMRLYKNFSPAPSDSPSDEFGHGSHVAGTIAGGNKSGQWIGVAPEAELIVARIFDANGSSDRKMILKAMQWVADPDGNPETNDHAQVVNSSWGDDDPYNDRDPENEPFCQIIQSWVKLNMVPVFSAGNSGPSPGTIGLPAGCPEAFSVGATEANDRSPHFSSTGPAVWKSISLVKPEVSAPGFDVKSAGKNGRWTEMSGTSMSAPHVAGAFALLLQAFPEARTLDLQRAMEVGAKDLGNPGKDGVFGWGRIDIPQAIQVMNRK